MDLSVLCDKLSSSSPEEIAKWISALKEENLRLRQKVKCLEEEKKSKLDHDSMDSKTTLKKAPNGSLSAAYGFKGSRVRPKDAAKAEIWGSEAAPAALGEVEGGGTEWESQPPVGFKPIGYMESCFLDKNGTPRQVTCTDIFKPLQMLVLSTQPSACRATSCRTRARACASSSRPLTSTPSSSGRRCSAMKRRTVSTSRRCSSLNSKFIGAPGRNRPGSRAPPRTCPCRSWSGSRGGAQRR